VSAGETITIDGDENLRRTLGNAEDELESLDQSENARLVEQRAKANAPKLTGQLAGSVRAKDLGKGAAQVSSELIYAPVINYGWPAHNIAAQPFLTEALADSAQLVEAHSQRQAQQILGKVRGA
jgi:hypothetical protein